MQIRRTARVDRVVDQDGGRDLTAQRVVVDVLREPLAQRIPRLLVGGDGQTNRRGRVWIGGGTHLTPIALTQQARNHRQRARTTDDVEGRHRPPVELPHGLLQGGERALHERLTALIERTRADDDRAGTLPPPCEINR